MTMINRKLLLFTLIFITLFLSGCKIIMPPVQDKRESSNYFYLTSEQTVTQKLKNVGSGFNGIVFLASGQCKKLEVFINEKKGQPPIFHKTIYDFAGSVRKSTYIEFTNILTLPAKELYLNINCSGGTITFAYNKNEADTDKIYYIKDTAGAGEMYYRSVYQVTSKKILSTIITNITRDRNFNVFYCIVFFIFFIQLFFKPGFILYRKFLPDSIATSKNFVLGKNIFLTGVLIRFIVMPFFMHVDMTSGLWVPYMMYNHDLLYYASDPDASFHLINQIFHLPFMMMSKIWFTDLYKLWEAFPYTYNLEAVYRLANLDSIYRLLFANKIFYVLADTFFIVLLIKILKKSGKMRNALWLWALNPVTIYVVYMIGRFELYALVFMLLTVYFFRKEKKIAGAVCLGIAAAFRQYPIMIFPIALLLLSRNLKDFIKYSILMAVPVIIYNFAHNFPAHYLDIAVKSPTKVLTNDQHSNMLFNYKIGGLVLFPFAYFLLLLTTWKNPAGTVKNFPLFAFVFFNVLYAFGTLEPQYYMWFIPFLIIMYAEKQIRLEEVITFFILYFLIVLQWDRDFSTYLALPLYPDLFYYLPAPERIINEYYPASIINQLATSFFIALNIFWAVRTIYRTYQVNSD